MTEPYLNGSQLKVELARLDERMKALVRDIARSEASGGHALKLASDELARRLDVLNHAHEEAREVLGTYITRDVYERDKKEGESRLLILEKLAERLWLPMIVIGVVAAGAGAAIVKLLFP